MRRTFFTVRSWLAVSCFLLAARSLDAATIEGRVVDSAGDPVAGAEVRIWQKFAGPDRRLTNRALEFDGSDVLHADAEGRFVSPDVLVGGAAALIVAEAEGTLAGRSDWFRIPKDEAAAKAPDITLKRLRIIIGQVLDRRGQPVDGATVFNSGDGHERVETTSKGGGKFRLAGVPAGGAFLFAEKPGCRLTGVRLSADQAEAALTLTAVDEAAEPLATLPPLLSPDEEYALAREVLDPWLEQLAKSGTPQQRRRGFLSLVRIDGLEAFKRLDWFADLDHLDQQNREVLQYAIILSVIPRHRRISWDELRAMIDSGENEFYKAAELVQASDEMDDDEQALRLQWLGAALPHARKVDDPELRVRVLAGVAERLFGLGEAVRAKQILVEAENIAKPLFTDTGAEVACLRLALAAAHDDADRAIGWLDKASFYLTWHGGRVAANFLPDRPRRAVEVWKRVVAANRAETRIPLQDYQYRAAAEFCYRLALVDRSLAEQIAADAENEAMRFWEQGAIILALAETQPAEARKRLTSLVREELPQLKTEDSVFPPLGSAPAVAAWLLPAAENVAPDLCRELLWRSLALRLPRPRRDNLNEVVEITDIELAKLLGRYDREIAMALLEPAAAKLPESAITTSGRRLFSAAVHIDPRWAQSLLGTVADSPSLTALADELRVDFVCTLALPPPDRWNGGREWQRESSAGFWAPSASVRPLPP